LWALDFLAFSLLLPLTTQGFLRKMLQLLKLDLTVVEYGEQAVLVIIRAQLVMSRHTPICHSCKGLDSCQAKSM
jgi:hypothetical protein